MSKVLVKMEEGKLVISADINEDGQPSLEIKVDLKEIPEEAWDAWKDSKKKKEA